MRFRLSIALLALGASLALPAAAQEESAQELFRQSAEAYRDGRFQDAVDLLRRAHEIDPAPILQYNLARALEGLGDFDGAVAAYEAYLEGEPDARDRGSIEARLETLRRQIAEREALAEAARRSEEEEAEVAAASDEPAAPPPAPSGPGPSVAPWVIAGVGAAAVGVAVALGVVAQDTNASAMEEPVHQRRVALVDEAHAFALAANVTYAAGGAIALAGVIWGIADVVSSGAEVEVAVGPGSVAVRGAF